MVETTPSPAPTGPDRLTWQKFVLGDWTSFVRDPLDVYRMAFIAAVVVWGALGHSVAGLVAASLVLVLARIVNLPRFYDFNVIVAMFLLAWGSALGWYGSWGFYDKVVHFLAPLLTTPIVYILLARLGVLPQLRDLRQLHHQLGFFLIALALGMAIGAGWEIVEWLLDQVTDAGRVESARDTATDLIADTLGSVGSGFILVGWSLAGWSLTRHPGAELADDELTSFFALRLQ